MSRELYSYGLVELIKKIENKQVSSLDVIHSFYDRVQEREGIVNAWQYLKDRDTYVSEYLARKDFYDSSLLKGLPLGVKDVIDTQEMPTEMGSPIHKGRLPLVDANCVLQFKNAGAIVMGKTVTTEFAYFYPGKTSNPHDANRTPGGSSSGSAAAVADNMVPMAIGTQTAASVIRPASYCGTIGHVGSINEYSTRGIQPLAQSFDAFGFFANSVNDISLLRDIALARREGGSSFEECKPLRVIVCDGLILGDVDAEMSAAFTEFVRFLEDKGAQIIPFQFGQELQNLIHEHHQVMAFEVNRNLVAEGKQTDLLSEKIKELVCCGKFISYADYLLSVKYIQNITDYYHSVLYSLGADVVIAPAASGVAPLGLDSTGLPFMSRPWQALGVPTITLPLYQSHKMPLGMQLIGKRRHDDELLKVAQWIEQSYIK